MVDDTRRTCAILGISISCLFTLWMLSSTSPTMPRTSSSINTQDLCTDSDEWNQGKWVHAQIGLEQQSVDGMSNFAGYHCNWDFAHRCYRRSNPLGEFNRSKAILDWSWQPDKCVTYPFEARKFSQHLKDNPILFVGDSITQLMFESMWCLTGQDMTAPKHDTHLNGGDRHMWTSQLVHRDLAYTDTDTNNVSVGYIRSDYLVKLDDFSLIKPNEGEGYQIGVGNNFPWVHAISRFKYIMINTGPHWHPDLKWGPNKSRQELLVAFKKGMTQAFNYLKSHLRQDQRVFVRGTPYGHAKCSQYTQPGAKAPSLQPGEYEWDLFEKFDFIWRDIIKDDARFIFFNVSLSNSRGDSHSMPDGDCLHTCLPGPVDDWNKYLYHMIKTEVDRL